MPLLLAGVTAALWGAADFLGGLSAASWRAMRAGAVAQAVGVAVLLPVLPFLETDRLTAADIGWGAGAGVGGALGITLLYRALATGPMNVAAPTTAVVGAAVPVAAGLALGERPGGLALLGVVLAIAAVGMIGSSPTGLSEEVQGWRVVPMAALAGVGLGLTGVAFAQTSESAGIWPAFAAKLSAALLLAVAILASRGGTDANARRGLGLSLSAGVVDVVATALFLVALQRGSLVLVSVIASLYPATTVVLARFALRETIGRVQGMGLALAAVAVALIAVS
ncbi:MAG TPA: EamA family transporter [Actinomycetota bacterium]|nr:EamA family transporter [Actinomycetota bacterium]